MAYLYNPAIDFSNDKAASVGKMYNVCKHFGALLFIKESDGLCCTGGKKIQSLESPLIFYKICYTENLK